MVAILINPLVSCKTGLDWIHISESEIGKMKNVIFFNIF